MKNQYTIQTREEFLRERRASLAAALAYKASIGNPDWYHIVDADEDVICDDCNGDVLEEKIHVYNNTNVFCEECRGVAL